MPAERLANIPTLGSGLGYRRELRDAIMASAADIDFVEVVTEQFLHVAGRQKELEGLRERFPVIPHGVGLSLGSAGPLDWEYLRLVKQVCDVTEAPYYSEHLAVTRAPGIDIGHLSPVWFTDEVLEIVINNVAAVQDYLERPLVVENISFLFAIPMAEMSESDFFCRLTEATGCGLLFDLANLYINSQNHLFEPMKFLDAMPLDAVVQVHLAGGHWHRGIFIDSHSGPVDEESWRLLDALVERVHVRASILEQDTNFPGEITPMLADVAHARRVIGAGRHNPAEVPGRHQT